MSNSATSTGQLYGPPRPKNKPIPISHSSIHSLATELSLAKSRLSSTTAQSGRTRGTKTKSLFQTPASNKGVHARAARDLLPSSSDQGVGGASSHTSLTSSELEHARRKLQEKTRLYNALRKGESVPSTSTSRRPPHHHAADDNDDDGPLVDFTRKWAEEGSASDSDSSDDDGPLPAMSPDEEMVEYTDEFGRTRMAPKSVAERETRKLQTQSHAVRDADDDGGGDANLIRGNFIQTHAFTTAQFSSLPSHIPMPGEDGANEVGEAHYDASAEVRTKGVGFYAFSKDSEERKRQMEQLEKARNATEETRARRENERKRRREELELRREEVRRRKRELVGERWLQDFMGQLQRGRAGNGEGSEQA